MCCVNIYKKQVDIYFLLAIDSHDLAIKDFFLSSERVHQYYKEKLWLGICSLV